MVGDDNLKDIIGELKLVNDYINPFPAVDKYICYGVFAQHARVHEQLVHLSSLHDYGKV